MIDPELYQRDSVRKSERITSSCAGNVSIAEKPLGEDNAVSHFLSLDLTWDGKNNSASFVSYAVSFGNGENLSITSNLLVFETGLTEPRQICQL